MKRLLFSLLFLLTFSPPAFAETAVDSNVFQVSAVFSEGALGPLLDNFNDGLNPNFWGGSYGSFDNGNGTDITVDYSAVGPLGGTGMSLRVVYVLPNAGNYGGLVIPLNALGGGPRDLRIYRFLEFWVRGNVANVSFKIELHNAGTDAAHRSSQLYINDYLDGGVTTEWQRVRIPFEAFANLNSLANVNEIVFVFERDYDVNSGFRVSGAIFLDNVIFGSGALPAIRVDHFGDNWGLNALGGNVGSFTEGGATHSHAYSNVAGNFHDFSRSLQSNYNVSNGFAGIYFIVGGGADSNAAYPQDFSGYAKINFWMKGNALGQQPGKIKIEIVDSLGIHFALVPDHTTTPSAPIPVASFGNYTINFSNFRDPVTGAVEGIQANSIRQVNIVYEDFRAGNRVGRVFYDEIEFLP